MKSALLPIRILLLMFLQLAQNARCFVSVTKPFSGRALRQLSTVVSYPSLSSHNHHQLALINCCAQPTSCRPRTQLFSSATDDSSVVPITVLSGFLGSGKTTLLQHMLTNNEGLKIAVIVNDVASVNIDSKLVRGQSATSDGGNNDQQLKNNNGDTNSALPAGIVELQNGCACCSISGELLSSVSELMTLSDMRQEDERFDHIVIEMSGVAEPRSVRNIFQEACMYDMPLMERVSLDTLVTVVDCSTYLDYLKSKNLANVVESPELFYRSEEERKLAQEEDGDGWMGGISPSLVDALNGGDESGYEGGVCDLLVEQTEVADLILLNKIDIAQGGLEDTQQLVRALNPRAKILSTSYGKIGELSEILAVSNGEGVAMDGVVDDHKDFVTAAESQDCSDPDCTNSLHDHGHSSHSHHHHDDSHSHDTTTCSDPECTDTSHSHSHSHSSGESACTDPGCTDATHDHSNGSTEPACTDPDCTDASHSHSHSHSSDTVTHAGIGSFVYRARRPFHPTRLLSLLQMLPVVRGVPTNGSDSVDGENEKVKKAFQQVVRSKGFAWTADSNVKALYWSHAGSSFEMQCLGRWWATLPKQQWPDEAKDSILSDFDSVDHDEATVSTTSSTVGDRRQEVVFIGPGLGTVDAHATIKSELDRCLLNDEEWDIFRSKRDDEASLVDSFENVLEARMLTY